MLFRGAVADISPTGMRIIADQYLPVGAKYTFTMKRNPFLTPARASSLDPHLHRRHVSSRRADRRSDRRRIANG